MLWLPNIWKQYIIHSSILICIMVIYVGAQHTRAIPSDILFYKKAIRIIAKVKYNDHTSPIFKKYNILRLPDIHNIQLGDMRHSITVVTLAQPKLKSLPQMMMYTATLLDQNNTFIFHWPNSIRLCEVSFIVVPNYGSNCPNMSKRLNQSPLTITVWTSELLSLVFDSKFIILNMF